MERSELIDLFTKRIVGSDETRTSILLTQFALELKSIHSSPSESEAVIPHEKVYKACPHRRSNHIKRSDGGIFCRKCRKLISR